MFRFLSLRSRFIHLHLLFVCVARAGPPKLSGKPQHRHPAKLGKNTKLVCPVEAHPTPFTEWKKDGEKINSAWTRFKVSEDRRGGSACVGRVVVGGLSLIHI